MDILVGNLSGNRDDLQSTSGFSAVCKWVCTDYFINYPIPNGSVHDITHSLDEKNKNSNSDSQK